MVHESCLVRRAPTISRKRLKPSFLAAWRCASLVVLCIAMLGLLRADGSQAAPVGLQWTGWLENGQDAYDMDAVQKSGATYYRLELNWGVAGQTNWKPYDEIFRLATERGITILPYLLGSPYDHDLPTGTTQLDEWQNFVREAVRRYGYGGSFWTGMANPRPVPAWEIWNEPNSKPYGVASSHIDPAAYGKLLEWSSIAAHAVEKGGTSQILVGGLLNLATQPAGCDPVNKCESLNSKKFLELLNAGGYGSYYDGVGVHPYVHLDEKKERIDPEDVAYVSGKVSEAIELVRNNVPLSKGLWVTEIGWPILNGLEEEEKEKEGAVKHPAVSSAVQAQLLTSVFNLIQQGASKWNVKAIIWDTYRSIADPHWESNTGLRTFQGKFLESWTRFQQQAGVAAWPPAPRIAYQANTGDLYTFTPPNVLAKPGIESLAPSTSPSVAGTTGTKLIAYQGKDHDLRVYSDATGFTHFGLGMAAETSPSIARQSNGYVVAYQANTGDLLLYAYPSTVLTKLGTMAPNTDPSAVQLVNGEYAIAWQAPNHNLWTYTPKQGAKEFGLGLSANTSPAIAPSGTGYVVAWRANTGSLWRYSSPLNQAVDLKTQVAVNTSPSITSVDVLANNYAIAWTSPTTNVSAYESSTGKVTTFELGASAEASPDISPAETGWRLVYRANTGMLWSRTNTGATYNYGQPIQLGTDPVVAQEIVGTTEVAYASGPEALLSVYTAPTSTVKSLGMAKFSPSTSPAAARLSNGSYAIAYQGAEHDLWRYTPEEGGRHDYLGMAANTSPAVTGLANGSYQVAYQTNTNHLALAAPGGWADLALGMAANTSPSIATLSNGGFVIAYQSNKGNLAVYCSSLAAYCHNPGGVEEFGLGMSPGTSPSITALGGKWAVAWRASNGMVWTLVPNPAKPFGEADIHQTVAMSEAGTSPSIAGLGAAVEVAYTAPGGSLYSLYFVPSENLEYKPAPRGGPLGLYSGTSPSLNAQTGNVIALTANTGYLWFFEPDPDVGTPTGLGMATGASPAVAPG